MKKKRDVFDVKLDSEEKELLESVERGEWKTVENAEKEAVFARKAAANSLRKDERELIFYHFSCFFSSFQNI